MDEQLAHFGHGQIRIYLIFKFMTCTSGCNYSFCVLLMMGAEDNRNM